MNQGTFSKWRTATFIGIVVAAFAVAAWLALVFGAATHSIEVALVTLCILWTFLFFVVMLVGSEFNEPY